MPEISEFTKRQQMAVIGHSLQETELWAQLDELGVTKEWYEGAPLQELYDRIGGFRAVYKRPPTREELENYLQNVDGMTYQSRKTLVENCIEASKGLGLDILRLKLVDWAKSRLVVTRAAELAKVYNAGNHQEAWKLWESGATALQRIDASVGATPDRMEYAASRISGEEAVRLKQAGKILEYGVSFLDDALVGIIPNDLIMVGARTGVGKTELAKIVAMHNAAKGKRVAFFALEAEEDEIERRIKFSMLLDAWEEESPGTSRAFGYAEWRTGKYKDSLDKFRDVVEAEFKARFPTLKTYYRARGDFAVEDLDREILKVFKDTDLIIIDHLHYVDLDGRDENAEMKRLVKRLRHLALGLGVPIFCIAHLKKGASKSLVPELDDFHGSSEITKIATTCIMLSKCHGFATAESGAEFGSPTFIRLAKFRLDGARCSYVGVAFYDKATGRYTKKYSVGRLNFAETKWIPLKGDPPDWANRKHTITEVSEVD